MSKAAEINGKKYLLVIRNLFPKIQDKFFEFEDGKIFDAVQRKRMLDEIKRALTILKSIDTTTLDGVLEKETIKKVESDVNNMYESLLSIENRIISDEYIENLLIPVKNYISKVVGTPSSYRLWAKNEDDLTKKFIAMLTKPENLEQYKSQIKRMSLGTMSVKEFKNIFNTLKHKMVATWEEQKRAAQKAKERKEKEERQKQAKSFNSFKEYKQHHEA
jgi:hypothetical protein